jgi:predicted house-cleaning noncanonical NTP pyrophosphatase (MazG superfamily)
MNNRRLNRLLKIRKIAAATSEFDENSPPDSEELLRNKGRAMEGQDYLNKSKDKVLEEVEEILGTLSESDQADVIKVIIGNISSDYLKEEILEALMETSPEDYQQQEFEPEEQEAGPRDIPF